VLKLTWKNKENRKTLIVAIAVSINKELKSGATVALF